MYSKIIAVDFDGTLCENKWPKIGEANKTVIEYVKRRKADGDKLILWTNRVGERLTEAVAWCSEHGLIFDAVNKNLPEIIESFGSDTRKIFANEYIDDRNFFIIEKMSQSDHIELCGKLIDVVEDWLEEKGLTAKAFLNTDHEDSEGGAIICGADYDYLVEQFASVIGLLRNY